MSPVLFSHLKDLCGSEFWSESTLIEESSQVSRNRSLDKAHHNVVGFIDRFSGASSVSPNNLEHLEGSPLYVISGALEVATAAGGCLKKSEGRDEGGGNEGDAGAGDPPANCLGGGIGGGVGLGVVSAVVATGGVQTVF